MGSPVQKTRGRSPGPEAAVIPPVLAEALPAVRRRRRSRASPLRWLGDSPQVTGTRLYRRLPPLPVQSSLKRTTSFPRYVQHTRRPRTDAMVYSTALHDFGRRAERPQLVSRDARRAAATSSATRRSRPCMSTRRPFARRRARERRARPPRPPRGRRSRRAPARSRAGSLLAPRPAPHARAHPPFVGPPKTSTDRRRQSRGAQPARLVHLANPPQQVDGGGVQAIGDLGLLDA